MTATCSDATCCTADRLGAEIGAAVPDVDVLGRDSDTSAAPVRLGRDLLDFRRDLSGSDSSSDDVRRDILTRHART